MKNQTEVIDQIRKGWLRYREENPEIAHVYDEYTGEVYKDGALKARDKRLMAMVGALVSGCTGCILSQADRAIDLGATAEHFYEAAAVATSLGGTMAAAETSKLMLYIEERGLVG